MPADVTSTALSIPTIVWSGIVASFITLAGVVLSNRSSLERLKEQLRHDAGEKHRDRISQLRKDVYLKLAAQMTYAGGHLGSLAGKDPTTEDLGGPLQEAMAELAKVQVVGSRETAALAAEMTAIYGEALFNLVAAAKPLHDLKIDIKISGDLYDQEFVHAKRVISEITALNESGTPNPAKMAALQRSFENYRQSYTQHSEERNAAWESYNAHNKPFLQAVFKELTKISPAQIKLLSAVRAEIGLDTDVSELNRRMEENQARMEKATADLLAHLDAS
ncbi:hypothetical protein ACFOLC_16030 [Lysobacter cavernae]|uniref:DNA repair protein n=1 Tax=Lysobacter cavernae TaxID=1685901 RepID=A0ABV7RSE2_9GAMM